jgi:hypothetical protein
LGSGIGGIVRRFATGPVLVVTALSIGCSNAKEGAVSGAGIGALSGLAIGSLSGNAGAGAAAGAIVGGVGGAVIGDQNRRKDEAAAQAAAAQEKSAQTAAYAPVNEYTTGAALGRLVGKWNVEGTIDGADGKSLAVSGSATGSVERTYFLRLDVRFNDPRNNLIVEGSSIISQTGGRGIEMTNSFSTSPEMRIFTGKVDDTGSVFTFTQKDPAEGPRRITIRTTNGKGFTADMWNGDKRVESYTFKPA